MRSKNEPPASLDTNPESLLGVSNQGIGALLRSSGGHPLPPAFVYRTVTGRQVEPASSPTISAYETKPIGRQIKGAQLPGVVSMERGSTNQSNIVLAIARSVGTGMYRRRSRTERRKSGRVNQGTVACNLGSVINLSAGGLRLLSHRRLNGILSVELWDAHRGLRLRGKVAWCRRIGFRKHEVGVEFLNITPEIADNLAAMAIDDPR